MARALRCPLEGKRSGALLRGVRSMRGSRVLAQLVAVPLLGILALPACAAEGEDVAEDESNVSETGTSKLAFDVNDVSVPLPGHPEGPVPSIMMSPAEGLDLFPQSVMADIANFQSKQRQTRSGAARKTTSRRVE